MSNTLTATVAPVALDAAAIAALAADKLTAALAASKDSAAATLSDRYGYGVDAAAVSLARLVALDVAGAKPGKGNRRTQVLRTLDALAAMDATAPDDHDYVAAARTVLDAAAAAKVEERAAAKVAAAAIAADRAAAMAVVNNRGASKQSRIEALELVSELDGTRDRAKDDAAWGKLVAAIEAARAYGFTLEQIGGLVATFDLPTE